MKIKIPFLSELLKIKKLQLLYEEEKIQYLKEIKKDLKKLNGKFKR
jgi:hypothetical protein